MGLLLIAAVVVLVVVALGRMWWRIWRGNEEPQAGGSMGRQLLDRTVGRK